MRRMTTLYVIARRVPTAPNHVLSQHRVHTLVPEPTGTVIPQTHATLSLVAEPQDAAESCTVSNGWSTTTSYERGIVGTIYNL